MEGTTSNAPLAQLIGTYRASPEHLNLPDWRGFLPLHAAVSGGDTSVALALLSLGADPFALTSNEDHKSVLDLAVDAKEVRLAEYLVATYPKLLNLNKRSSLLSALMLGAPTLAETATMAMKELSEDDQGAILSYRGEGGMSALHAAINRVYSTDTIDRLFDACYNLTDDIGSLPLHSLAMSPILKESEVDEGPMRNIVEHVVQLYSKKLKMSIPDVLQIRTTKPVDPIRFYMEGMNLLQIASSLDNFIVLSECVFMVLTPQSTTEPIPKIKKKKKEENQYVDESESEEYENNRFGEECEFPPSGTNSECLIPGTVEAYVEILRALILETSTGNKNNAIHWACGAGSIRCLSFILSLCPPSSCFDDAVTLLDQRNRTALFLTAAVPSHTTSILLDHVKWKLLRTVRGAVEMKDSKTGEFFKRSSGNILYHYTGNKEASYTNCNNGWFTDVGVEAMDCIETLWEQLRKSEKYNDLKFAYVGQRPKDKAGKDVEKSHQLAVTRYMEFKTCDPRFPVKEKLIKKLVKRIKQKKMSIGNHGNQANGLETEKNTEGAEQEGGNPKDEADISQVHVTQQSGTTISPSTSTSTVQQQTETKTVQDTEPQTYDVKTYARLRRTGGVMTIYPLHKSSVQDLLQNRTAIFLVVLMYIFLPIGLALVERQNPLGFDTDRLAAMFVGSLYLLLFVHLKTSFKDPGILPKYSTITRVAENNGFYVDVAPKMKESLVKRSDVYCFACNNIKIPRSKHCGSHNVCVAGFDHCCPWIGSDVGCKNHIQFISLLSLSVLVNGFWTSFFLFKFAKTIHLVVKETGGFMSAVWAVIGLKTSMFMFIILQGFLTVWTLMLLLGNVYGILLDLLTFESSHIEKLWYFKKIQPVDNELNDKSDIVNHWDRGACVNLWRFFTGKRTTEMLNPFEEMNEGRKYKAHKSTYFERVVYNDYENRERVKEREHKDHVH